MGRSHQRDLHETESRHGDESASCKFLGNDRQPDDAGQPVRQPLRFQHRRFHVGTRAHHGRSRRVDRHVHDLRRPGPRPRRRGLVQLEVPAVLRCQQGGHLHARGPPHCRSAPAGRQVGGHRSALEFHGRNGRPMGPHQPRHRSRAYFGHDEPHLPERPARRGLSCQLHLRSPAGERRDRRIPASIRRDVLRVGRRRQCRGRDRSGRCRRRGRPDFRPRKHPCPYGFLQCQRYKLSPHHGRFGCRSR